MNRNSLWKEVWNKKSIDAESGLHVANGYDLLSGKEYDHLVSEVVGIIPLKPGDNVIEFGCGAGAFLASLSRLFSGIRLTGLDYAESLINVARQCVQGDFFVANISDVGFLSEESFDHSFSFGVFFYLSSLVDAKKALFEMFRITKPGGVIYIGEIPDEQKKSYANAIRKLSHKDVKKLSSAEVDHLYFHKDFFRDFAHQQSADIQIVDHTELDLENYQAAQYRYSVYIRKALHK
ncbi:MAG: class I SAM-dependent methyltransferase [Limnohabitans sp.]